MRNPVKCIDQYERGNVLGNRIKTHFFRLGVLIFGQKLMLDGTLWDCQL